MRVSQNTSISLKVDTAGKLYMGGSEPYFDLEDCAVPFSRA